ncbi:MAG TPA: EamA family transporter, partial [Spirochaetia bacterium]|nr:EamA family transporter [Spirochaetia bacterium]
MNNSWKVYAALLITVLFWGLSFIGTKTALVYLHPFSLVFLRFAGASIVLLAILSRRGFPKLSRADHVRLIALSLLQPGAYFLCETFALEYASASKVSLIIGAIPVVVTSLAALILRERARPRQVFASLFSVVGIVLLILGERGFRWESSGSIAGDLLALGAVVTASLYTLLSRELGKTRSSLEITSMQMFYGTLFFLPFFLATAGKSNWHQVTPTVIGAVIFLALGASVAAFLAYNYALTKVTASRASIYINGIPVVTTLAAWIGLGETLTWIQL